MIVKMAKKKKKVVNSIAAGQKPKKACRVRNICQKCGRSRGYIRYFGICRICAREFARAGEIPGLRKSSW